MIPKSKTQLGYVDEWRRGFIRRRALDEEATARSYVNTMSGEDIQKLHAAAAGIPDEQLRLEVLFEGERSSKYRFLERVLDPGGKMMAAFPREAAALAVSLSDGDAAVHRATGGGG